MLDFEHSTQLNSWLYTPALLAECRERANRETRISLSSSSVRPEASTDSLKENKNSTQKNYLPLPVKSFACGYYSDFLQKERSKGAGNSRETVGGTDTALGTGDAASWNSSEDRGSHPLLTPDEEQHLIQFYAGKLSNLMGPKAQIPRCRRDVKVVATAALLFRRFYLSNSVMAFDPKAVMVAAAFLASKVEDATLDIHALEHGTKQMQAPVATDDIIAAELVLLEGLDFDLMCYHPYKTVLAYTEDLRTYLKSERGRAAVVIAGKETSRPPIISGEDLRPMHDEARRIVDDACVSDIPLIYTPGQVGLAAMIVASEDLNERGEREEGDKKSVFSVVKIDMYSYVKSRFEGRSAEEHGKLEQQMKELTNRLRELRQGKYGCGNHGIDMVALKAVHKKLKKCKAWGAVDSAEGKDGKKKKKKKKRKATEEPSE